MRTWPLLIALYASTVTAAEISNHQSTGNLQSLNKLSCIEKEKIQNTYTPADLYPAVSRCIKEENYDKGIYLFMVAGAYGYYDANRVSDKTSRQAIQVLQMQNLWPLDENLKKGFQNKLTAFANNKDSMKDACNFISKLGKPNYYPSYMIQHGIKSFTGTGQDGLLQKVNLDEIWHDASVNYIKCKK